MRGFVQAWGVFLGIFLIAGAGAEAQEIDAKKLLSQPKAYVGSDVCKTCHLEHYDAWKRTLHSKMLQDVRENADILVTDINPETIRADLAKLGDKLKVPADEVYIPSMDEIHYAIGSTWKQRFLIQKDGTYFISPIQFNVDTGRWVNYHEHDWQDRPWMLKCGGCHATGVDLDANTFVEPGVGCEACHGPGSHHAALPASETFEKRATIVNPSKLTPGVAVQICGSCHNRGKATMKEGSGWAVGYTPGKALEVFYASIEAGSKYLYSNEFSKDHHQQYIDWQKSAHAKAGVDCLDCHVVHELGNPAFRGKTLAKGDQLCLTCHAQTQQIGAHSVHSFGNCSSCHMPKIAKSAESGDIHSHVFVAIEPKVTKELQIPNSCQLCHRHAEEDIDDLQRRWDELTARRVSNGNVVKAND